MSTLPPLHAAVMNRHLDAVIALVSAGASISQEGQFEGVMLSALQIADRFETSGGMARIRLALHRRENSQ